MFGCGRRTARAVGVALVAAGLLLNIAGCGVKAPPVAPNAAAPVIATFGHTLENGRLLLSWSLTADSPDPRQISLYRSQTPLADKPCDGCPLVFKPLKTIPAGGRKDGSVTIAVDQGYHYGFKLRATADNGLAGPDSQTIRFDY
jgi:predicted small lipoprotein YifL